jgi:outer membrane autotransporter protein
MYSSSVRVCPILDRKWLVFLAILLAATELPAQTWNTGTGSWFDPENWKPATIPTGVSVVTVANGGTAQIEAKEVGATANASELTVGSTSTVLIGMNSFLDVNRTVLNSGNIVDVGANAAVTLPVGIAMVVNSGTISSPSNVAIFFDDTTGSVTNNSSGVLTGGPDHSVIFSSTGPISVSNAGKISGSETGIHLSGGGSIINSATGSIIGLTGTAVLMDTFGNTTIVNSGTISTSADAIHFEGSTSGSVTNNPGGVITGGTDHSAIASDSAGEISIINAGVINGAVNLGSASNTVKLLAGGSINGNLNLGPNSGSILILDGNGVETIGQAVTGTITDFGSLTKQGSGNWIIDFNQELTAPVSTHVLAGTFTVNGSLTSSMVTIAAGAMLNGSGTITGNLTSSGIVSPGNSPGITVNGNYTQNAAGTLRIGIAGIAPGQFDLLAVNGHASLAGTLQLIGLGGFTLHVGNQLTFLTARDGVSGSFGTVQNEIATGTIVKAEIVTLSNAVVLEGTQGSFVEAACNPNSGAVAKALDSAVGNPRASTLIAFLNDQPLNNLCGDFTLIAPEALASIFNAGISLANVQTANLTRRMEDVRAGSNGFSSSGFTLNGGGLTLGGGLAGVTGPEGKSGPSVMAPTPENRWGVWVTGIGEFANVDSNNGAAGYDIHTGGVTFGVDYRVCSIFAIGLTAGYANEIGDLADGGDLDVNAGQLGLYATLFSGGLYADAAVTGGPSGYDTHRTGLLGSANGSTDGGNLNAFIAAGYDWKKGGLSIGPTANFQYSYVGVSGFTESGSIAPLKIDSQNAESERTALGMKASYEWKVGHVIVKPEISAAWQHEFGDQAYSIVASFANGAGNGFTVTSPQIGRDSLLIGAGAAVLLSDRISIYAYYDGELLRTNYQSNSVSAGVRVTF